MDQIFADIIFPLALEGSLSYRVPPEMASNAVRGCQIKAPVGNRIHTGVICSIRRESEITISDSDIKDIQSIETALPTIPEKTLRFWEWIAGYYMCPPGMVAKWPFPLEIQRRAQPKERDPGALSPPGLPLYVQGVERVDYYMERIRKSCSRGQCLIITLTGYPVKYV